MNAQMKLFYYLDRYFFTHYFNYILLSTLKYIVIYDLKITTLKVKGLYQYAPKNMYKLKGYNKVI